MTELELYKFVQDKEMDWRGDSLVLWLYPSEIDEFTELTGNNIFDDGGLEVHLQSNGSIAIELEEVCIFHGIDPEHILKKEGDAV